MPHMTTDVDSPVSRYYVLRTRCPRTRQTRAARSAADEIIAEILRNAEAGQFRMRRSVVIPCVYHLYLHQADYDLIRPVFKALREEARAALTDQIAALNRKGKPGKLARMLGLESGATEPEYRISGQGVHHRVLSRRGRRSRSGRRGDSLRVGLSADARVRWRDDTACHAPAGLNFLFRGFRKPHIAVS